MTDLPITIQPRLQMSAATAAMIASGQAYRVGGVVREAGSKRLVELLAEAPDSGQVVETAAGVVRKARVVSIDLTSLTTPKIDSKTALAAGGMLLVAGAAAGGYRWIANRRHTSEPPEPALPSFALDEDVQAPDCLQDLRTSLDTYVSAGRRGALTVEIVDALIRDFDAVKSFSGDRGAIVFTLEELLPFFEVVSAHTPVLASAYSAEGLGTTWESSDVVTSLRQHLERQGSILAAAVA